MSAVGGGSQVQDHRKKGEYLFCREGEGGGGGKALIGVSAHFYSTRTDGADEIERETFYEASINLIPKVAVKKTTEQYPS